MSARASIPPLFILGTPGPVGGAATKIAHLIKLLHNDFSITMVATEVAILKHPEVRRRIEPFGVPCILINQIPAAPNAVCLAICDRQFFAKGRPWQLKSRGLKVIWSNEMMWPFEGEEESVKRGAIDRVLFASKFQAQAFAHIYEHIPSYVTGNYVDPDDYCWTERKNPVFTLGRLSRPDTAKYPADFPVFYESLGLADVRYRVMAWNNDLQRRYKWHRFGPEWELLSENRESALKFLRSLDVFLYPLGHLVKESWGRAVVEAMLTGCVPVVPSGHQFHNFIAHADTGFICTRFCDFRDAVVELYENYELRKAVSLRASAFARESLCNPEQHRRSWIEALTFK